MRYAVDVAPLGELADPAAIVWIAQAAEAAGWDGLSVWDSLGVSMGADAADPFVALAAAAAATTRLRLIASVVALPRRRPHLVAQSVATLDRLSGGRVVLGVGAGGDPADFETFGEPWDAATRVARMDEGLRIVDRLLRGETVEHVGEAYVIRGAAVGPSPVQRPRPPIWIGGMRAGALRRAARWDGWIPVATSDDGSSIVLPPEGLRAAVDRTLVERRASGLATDGFDVAVFAFSDADDDRLARGYEAAGATWWLESLSELRGSFADLLARVEAGPPRGGRRRGS